MKAVAIHFPSREVRVIDAPEPALRSPTQARVRTLEVGICGTDRDILDGRHGAPPPGEDFLILGHEALGEVVEVGSAVQGLQAGDLVVPRVRRPCPHATCSPCRRGYPDFCITGDYTERGIRAAHGFGARFFVEDVAYLHRVPGELREVAVLTEPLTIAEKALWQVERVQGRLPWRPQGPGSAVVLGAGPVGLLGAMALLRAGYTTTVYSRTPPPNPSAEVAGLLGAPYLSTEQVAPEELARRSGPIDLVYEAAGAPRAAFELLGVLGPNGVFIFTGVPGRRERLTQDGSELMRGLVLGNQLVFGTVNASGADFDAALEDLGRFRARWPGGLEGLITKRHPPDSYPRAIREKGIKHVITFG